MKFKLLLTALLLGLALQASAQFESDSDAYEVALDRIRLPQIETGTIAYKPCRDCDYRRTRVTGETRWVLNGSATTLEKFRERVRDVEDPGNRTATVIRHKETNSVTQVSVYIR